MQLAEEELAQIDGAPQPVRDRLQISALVSPGTGLDAADEDEGEKAPARETAPAVPAPVPARPVPEELGALLSALMGNEDLEQLQHVLDSSVGESGPPPAARDARFAPRPAWCPAAAARLPTRCVAGLASVASAHCGAVYGQVQSRRESRQSGWDIVCGACPPSLPHQSWQLGTPGALVAVALHVRECQL
jgi:hypothetical protein